MKQQQQRKTFHSPPLLFSHFLPLASSSSPFEKDLKGSWEEMNWVTVQVSRNNKMRRKTVNWREKRKRRMKAVIYLDRKSFSLFETDWQTNQEGFSNNLFGCVVGIFSTWEAQVWEWTTSSSSSFPLVISYQGKISFSSLMNITLRDEGKGKKRWRDGCRRLCVWFFNWKQREREETQIVIISKMRLLLSN